MDSGKLIDHTAPGACGNLEQLLENGTAGADVNINININKAPSNFKERIGYNINQNQ